MRRFDAGEKYDKLLAELAEPTAQRAPPPERARARTVEGTGRQTEID